MAQWRIKEISDLTGVSVRTLHHYDQTDLLKPSVRTSNGYRWYSEKNLATLQQIIALKSFGFSLGQIKTMLQRKPRLLEHLRIQQQVVAEQLEHLRQTHDLLATVIERSDASGSPEWNDVLSLIERYAMAETLQDSWLSKLSDEQRAHYNTFKKEFPEETAELEAVIEKINNREFGDPEGPDGREVVEIQLRLMRKTQAATARGRKFGADILRSIKEGKLTELQLSPEGLRWFAKATLAYWLHRWNTIYEEIKNNLANDPTGNAGAKAAAHWRAAIEDVSIGTPHDFLMGTMIWQNIANEDAKIKEQPTPQPATELIKDIRVPLFFDPEAIGWIETALRTH